MGNRANVAGNAAGVLIFDVTTPASPSLVDSLPTSQSTQLARFANGYVSATAGTAGVDIVSEALRTPEFAATIPLSVGPAAMDFDRGRLAVSASDLFIIDVTDLESSQIETTASVGGATA